MNINRTEKLGYKWGIGTSFIFPDFNIKINGFSMFSITHLMGYFDPSITLKHNTNCVSKVGPAIAFPF